MLTKKGQVICGVRKQMKIPLLICVASSVIVGCSQKAPEFKCKSGSEVYISAISNQLQADGILQAVIKNGKICYPTTLSFEAEKSIKKAENYYRGAAVLLDTIEEAELFKKWANNNKREFEMHNTESGKFFIVFFSESNEQFKKTQNILRCLGTINGCK